MSERGFVSRITPDGVITAIPNSYQDISDGVGASFDFVWVHPNVGFYVGDESLLDGSRFNLVASMMAGRALYGNAVLTHGDTDNEGDTLPPGAETVRIASNLAGLWRNVVENNNGQDVCPQSNADLVPPMQFSTYANEEEFFKVMGWSSDAADGAHRTESI